ncbi:MAG TPA: HlyD family efflux transporter periplasmic adaptor subunit [Ktedonobacteraceae bacterium]|jgi:multidrug resistance efflux pump|nr:HlyD family efflux transporter periplasmic adaptor subunit [Ktedonobacteraceae bacterium]
MRRRILIPLVIGLAVLLAVGVGGYLLYTNYYFYSTDDAVVTGNIVNIAPTIPGTLASLNVQVGSFVSAGQNIGTVEGNPPSFTTQALIAPINGVIVQVPGVVGQSVTAQQTVVQETDLNGVKITAYVDESALSNIHVGQPVDIHVDAYGSQNFTGHVSQIVDVSASQFSLLPTEDYSSGNFTKVSQRFPVYIVLDNGGQGMLLPGMSAEVTIHLH